MILYYQLAITAALLIFFGIAIRNLFLFPKIKKSNTNTNIRTFPKVSIMVPARNEEKSIQACVESLLSMDYPDFEVIVLNDNSTDATGSILESIVERYPEKLTVINGTPLPQGWVGKPWACHQLSQHAKGELLLFTDADTVHSSESLRAVVEYFLTEKVDFVSMIPYEKMDTWGEATIIPMIHYLYFAYLPNDWIAKKPSVSVSAANGQYMFFKSEVYRAIGGHTAVKNNVVEDVFLARTVKKEGYITGLINGSEIVTCKMYWNFKETFEGFSKNFYPGMSYRPFAMFTSITHFFLLYIAPVIFLIFALVTQNFSFELFWLPLLHYTIFTTIRGIITYSFSMPIYQMFLHPLCAALAIGIGINSVRWSRSKIQWKGRSYSKEETI
ncbi:MAG: glycosyltransferase [Candidatus Kapabacteria bacterium]|nr:glycosyltransferase [Candidatus Kapabacteria bacterium]